MKFKESQYHQYSFFFFDKYVNFIIMAMVMTQRIQSDFETNPNASMMLSKAEV